jgi:hypothetical protein
LPARRRGQVCRHRGSLRRPGMTTVEKARYRPALRPPPSAAATVSHRA